MYNKIYVSYILYIIKYTLVIFYYNIIRWLHFTYNITDVSYILYIIQYVIYNMIYVNYILYIM